MQAFYLWSYCNRSSQVQPPALSTQGRPHVGTLYRRTTTLPALPRRATSGVTNNDEETQAVVIENLSGASGSFDIQKLLSAAADGQQMMIGTPSDVILAPLTLKSIKHRPSSCSWSARDEGATGPRRRHRWCGARPRRTGRADAHAISPRAQHRSIGSSARSHSSRRWTWRTSTTRSGVAYFVPRGVPKARPRVSTTPTMSAAGLRAVFTLEQVFAPDTGVKSRLACRSVTYQRSRASIRLNPIECDIRIGPAGIEDRPTARVAAANVWYRPRSRCPSASERRTRAPDRLSATRCCPSPL